MKYENIIRYANHANTLSGLFGIQTTYNLKYDVDRIALRAMLKDELSPEHLTCDGELSMKQTKVKYDYYTQCLRELDEIDKLDALA